MKFRNKPVVIEAERTSVLIHNAAHDWKALPPWFVAAYERGGILILNTSIEIATPEGTMVAQFADLVICGVKGELYPCKPDIFAATYEPVEAEGGRDGK